MQVEEQGEHIGGGGGGAAGVDRNWKSTLVTTSHTPGTLERTTVSEVGALKGKTEDTVLYGKAAPCPGHGVTVLLRSSQGAGPPLCLRLRPPGQRAEEPVLSLRPPLPRFPAPAPRLPPLLPQPQPLSLLEAASSPGTEALSGGGREGLLEPSGSAVQKWGLWLPPASGDLSQAGHCACARRGQGGAQGSRQAGARQGHCFPQEKAVCLRHPQGQDGGWGWKS